MKYELTVYGPFKNNINAITGLSRRVKEVLEVTGEQVLAAIEVLKNHPSFNHAKISKYHGGDLVVTVYGEPTLSPKCDFYAKITPQGVYE